MKQRQYRLSLVWFLLLVIDSQATFAQITEWIPVTSPFGESVAQLWQISDGDLFAAIGNPGTSLIYRSTDDGFTWQFESISIRVDAVSANGTFFAAGSYLGEPFHSSIEHFSLMSTDFGRTWSIPLIITPENVGFAFVPTNGARVFAMGGQTLFASDSEGIDWFEISFGPDIPPPNAWLRLATGKEGVVIAITDDAFMVSTNDGDSWDKRVQQFGEHPVSDLVILNENRFAGLKSGALQYTGDGGLHWVSRPLPAERGIVSGLTIFGIQNLFLSTNKGGFVSDNQGQSWQQIEYGELVFQTMLSTLSGDVLAGTSEGVYRQSASGSWISSTLGIPKLTGTVSVLSDGDLFILSESGEMYRSSDRGISWLSYGAPENARVVGLAEGVDGTLYLASRREPGVYMWTNGGDSWVPLGLDGISALTVMESGTILGVVGNDNRFFSSSDGGTNWEIVSQLDLGSSIRHLRSTGMGIVYAASYRGLHRSDDEGRTWVHVLNEPTRELHVASEGAIWFVSTNGDLFQSTDEGETWAEVNGPFDVFSLGVTNGNSLFASSEMGELWRSNNLGESWYHFEQVELPEPAQALEGVTAPFSGFGFPEITLKIDRDGYLYAMLYGLFYRSDSAIATSIERPAVELPSASFMDIYPNPTRDVAHLSFRLNQAGPVRLSVFDTIGREVAVLDDGYKSQGTYEFSLRKAGLSTGIYFVRLKASDSNQTKKLVLLR